MENDFNEQAKKELASIEQEAAKQFQICSARGLSFMDRIAKGEKIPADELQKHQDQIDQLKKIQQMYSMMKSMGFVDKKGGSSKEFNTGFVEEIKKMKSSVGAIVKTSDDLRQARGDNNNG